MPSAMSTCRFRGGCAINGSTCQHQAVCRRNERPCSAWLRPPRSQATNDSSSLSRAAPVLDATTPASHSGHFQRCEPAVVLPFFFIRPPHNGQRFAFLERVLTPSSGTRQTPYFPAGKTTPQHAYTHKAKPQS